MNQTLLVLFCGRKLVAVEKDGEVFVAMRPIVEAMGLGWGAQNVKLNKNKEKLNCFGIETVGADRKARSMLCIPLKKLNGWLFSINPSKVREDLRDLIIRYQEECFMVLYEYWTTGKAIKEDIQRQIDEWLKRDEKSFNKGSIAGRALNDRKKEKHFIAGNITKLQMQLSQPDLFVGEGL